MRFHRLRPVEIRFAERKEDHRRETCHKRQRWPGWRARRRGEGSIEARWVFRRMPLRTAPGAYTAGKYAGDRGTRGL